jgi:23S rRNA (guanosine2251-2'-O)-methyltransferase
LRSPGQPATSRREMLSVTGLKVVEEFVRSTRQTLSEVCFIRESKKGAAKSLLEMARRKGINIRELSAADMRAVHEGKIKNGIVGRLEHFHYADMDELIENRAGNVLFVMLDRVYDPHNVGAIARTAHCFGADAIIIQEKRAGVITAAAIYASAGALAHLPVVKAVNLSKTAEYLKGKRDFWVYGTSTDKAGIDIETLDPPDNVLIIFGSEGEGIRKKLLEKCDFTLNVALPAAFDSLNVSVAAGIILHALNKKYLHRKGGK